MSNEPKKRPWFQIHLSTAVILMFVAGGFLWLNCRFQDFVWNASDCGEFGFPFAAIEMQLVCNHSNFKHIQQPGYDFNYSMLAVDLICAIVILVVSCLMCERWIRRSAPNARK